MSYRPNSQKVITAKTTDPRRVARRKRAQERQAAYEALTPMERLQRVQRRVGTQFLHFTNEFRKESVKAPEEDGVYIP